MPLHSIYFYSKPLGVRQPTFIVGSYLLMFMASFLLLLLFPVAASSLLFLIISSVKCSHVPPCTLDCTHSTQVAAFTLIEFFSNLSLSEFECRSQRLHSHEGHVVQCDLNLNLDFSGSTRQHFPWE